MKRTFMQAGLVCLVFLMATDVFAQNARLSGLVSDRSGAVIPGAKVVATNVATGIVRETISTELGLYVIEALLPSEYEVSCELPGFKRFVSTNNVLTVGQSAVLNITLDPGDITQEVTVTEMVAAVQTQETQVRTEITGTLVREIPLNGRNPLHLILSGAPGISGRGTGIYVNGQKTQSTNTTLDGIDVNDATLARAELSLVPMNPDTIQEYQLVTSNARADTGRSSGGQVSVVTKSGTNQFHGSLYEYHRNTVLNANSFFNNATGVKKPVLIRNTYGGSIGGPILKDKAFFFFNYNAFRQAESIPISRTVLTADARRGIFRYARGVRNTTSLVDANGAYIGTAPLLTYNIAANDPLGVGADRVVAAIMAQTPLPNSFTGGDGLNTALFRFNAPSTSNNDSVTARVDYNFNSNHAAFVRYSYGDFLTDGDNINAGLQRYPGLIGRNQESRRQGAALSLRSTLSATLLNEAVIGFQRSFVKFNNPQYPDGLTIQSATFTDPVNNFAGTGRVAPVFQMKDNLTKVIGSHTYKGGLDFRFTQFNQYRKVGTYPVYPRATVSRTLFPVAIPNQPPAAELETNNVNTLRSLMMDVLGVWSRVEQTFFGNGKFYLPTGGQYIRGHRFREYDWFFQDDWRIGHRVTMNYGVRWEYRAPPFEVNGVMFTPDSANFENGPGALSFSLVGKDGKPRWFSKDMNNFAPTVGLAWDVFGDGRTSIRASYRIAYDRVTSWVVNDSDQTTPGASADVTALNSGDLRTAGRLATFRSSLAPPSTFTTIASNNRSGRPVLFDDDFRTPYVQQWVLGVQREVIPDLVVEVMYLGNKGSKLYRNFNINQLDVTNSGFLESFRVAQNNLALATAAGAATGANYNAAIPGSQRPVLLERLFGGSIPSAQNTNIQQGVVGTVANNLDRPATLTAAGLPDNFFRPYPQFELLGFGCTCSNSTYHSLQSQVTRRYSNGFTVNGSYTWSKAIDDFSGRGDGIWVVRDVNNRALEKGPADFDARHIVRGSFVYELPIGQNRRWGSGLKTWQDHLLGGWQVNGLVDAASGNPMTLVSGRQTLVYTPFTDGLSNVDFARTGQATFGSVQRDSQGRVIFFNESERAQFAFPAAGSAGATGRNAFYGPGYWNFDFSLYKNFQVTEDVKVQFRSEFFNVLNHPVFNAPGGTQRNLGNADFGRIVSQRNDPRIMQFALRIDF